MTLLLTPAETGGELRVSLSTVKRLVQEGELDFLYVRGQLRIPRDSLDDYVSRQRGNRKACHSDNDTRDTGASRGIRPQGPDRLKDRLERKTGLKRKGSSTKKEPKQSASVLSFPDTVSTS